MLSFSRSHTSPCSDVTATRQPFRHHGIVAVSARSINCSQPVSPLVWLTTSFPAMANRSRSAYRSFLPALLSAFLAFPVIHAQTLLDFSVLPACAQGCTLLQQAQGACVPPAVPAGDQAAAQGCFCQSAYLRTLYQSPNGVCDAFCGQPDLVSIQGWYVGLCQAGVPTTTAPAPGATETPAASGAQEEDDGARSSQRSNDSNSGNWSDAPLDPPTHPLTPPRFSNHWRWVVMLIVIFFAMVFFTVLGIWLKRRHRRKRDLARANLAAPESAIQPVPPVPDRSSFRNSARTAGSMREVFGGGSVRSMTPVPTPMWGPNRSVASLSGLGYPIPPSTPRPDSEWNGSRRGSRSTSMTLNGTLSAYANGTGSGNNNGKGRMN